jgi:hypothetical protein
VILSHVQGQLFVKAFALVRLPDITADPSECKISCNSDECHNEKPLHSPSFIMCQSGVLNTDSLVWLAVYVLFQCSERQIPLWDSFPKFNFAQSLVTFDVP